MKPTPEALSTNLVGIQLKIRDVFFFAWQFFPGFLEVVRECRNARIPMWGIFFTSPDFFFWGGGGKNCLTVTNKNLPKDGGFNFRNEVYNIEFFRDLRGGLILLPHMPPMPDPWLNGIFT